MKSNYESNNELLDKIRVLINKYPQQRFCQLLCNYILPKDIYYNRDNAVNTSLVMKDIFYIENDKLINNINAQISYEN